MNYYNEFDPYAAQWLRNLIAAELIPAGIVDERSIEDVKPNELTGYTQCHFFAGIGGWSLALRLAGWPEDRPIWTGSCPCQPFSAAGKGLGVTDERHLWPAWFHLIEQCQPDVIFGEQVEAAIKHGLLDLIQTDLEGTGYAVAPVCVPAAGVGSPQGRHRLWFVADHQSEQCKRQMPEQGGKPHIGGERVPTGGCLYPDELADTDASGYTPPCYKCGETKHEGDQRTGAAADRGSSPSDLELPQGNGRDQRWAEPDGRSVTPGRRPDELADSQCIGRHRWEKSCRSSGEGLSVTQRLLHVGAGAGALNQPWRDVDWLYCRDGRWRSVAPGTFPLAHGVPGRVGRLRAYGNAIVPQVAAEIIKAFMECRP